MAIDENATRVDEQATKCLQDQEQEHPETKAPAKCAHCRAELKDNTARVCSSCRLGQSRILSFYDHRMNFLFAFAALVLGGGQLYYATQRAASAEEAKNKAESAAGQAIKALEDVKKLQSDISVHQRTLSELTMSRDRSERVWRLVGDSLNDSRLAFNQLNAIAKEGGASGSSAVTGISTVRQKYTGYHLMADKDERPSDASQVELITDPCQLIAELRRTNDPKRRLLIVRLLIARHRNIQEVRDELLLVLRTDGSMRVCGAIVWSLETGTFERRLTEFDEFAKEWSREVHGPAHGPARKAGCRN